MSTTAHVHGALQDFRGPSFQKAHKFFLNTRNTDPSYSKNAKADGTGGEPVQFPISYMMRLQEDVYYEDTKNQEKSGMRTMRIIRGERSIWADEQKRFEDTDLKEIPVDFLEFVNGLVVVDDREKQLFEFLSRSERNVKNCPANRTAIFFHYDAEAGFRGVLEDEKKTLDMTNWCMKGDWDEVRAYATILQVPIEGLSTEEVRYNLLVKAKANPEKFSQGLHTPVLKIRHWLNKALSLGIIKVDNANGIVLWSAGKAIIKAPTGKSPLDHFAEDINKATADSPSRIVYQNIRQFVEAMDAPAINEVKETVSADAILKPGQTLKEVAPEAAQRKEIGGKAAQLPFEEWLKACVERGFVIKSGTWHRFLEHGNAEDEIFKSNSIREMQSYFGPGGVGEQWTRKSWDLIDGVIVQEKKEVPEPLAQPVNNSEGSKDEDIFN